jgi:hypothetical protein
MKQKNKNQDVCVPPLHPVCQSQGLGDHDRLRRNTVVSREQRHARMLKRTDLHSVHMIPLLRYPNYAAEVVIGGIWSNECGVT